ncbi:MAG: hypothetical protein HGB03_00450 [Candidatus Yonathbacteria bacterium]|nr:hypothetical protein [Candidatus Yonathbacteria bacterium]NTW47735.1 hypothetical protein [Candidatus Yonathbacteria bacterium]
MEQDVFANTFVICAILSSFSAFGVLGMIISKKREERKKEREDFFGGLHPPTEYNVVVPIDDELAKFVGAKKRKGTTS